MAPCPNCKASIPIDAQQCPACAARFGGDAGWRPEPETPREENYALERERERMRAGQRQALGRYVLSLPKSGGVRLMQERMFSMMLLARVFFWGLGLLLFLLFLADGQFMLGLPLGALLGMFAMLAYIKRRQMMSSVTIYPAQASLVVREGGKKTMIELRRPLNLYLESLRDDVQARVQQARLPILQGVTGNGPRFVRLMLACAPGDRLIAFGTEDEMVHLREELWRHMQALAAQP